MSALETYTKAAKEARGIMHIAAIRNLRMYIRNEKPRDLIKEIDKINDTEQLRTLIEAGLDAILQMHVVDRYDEIQKRRAGVI
jgi:predicted xylose isomerase-like sugar epimerase